MGANATTSVPTYTAGQVLEAADLNITNSGVPVFADSTARDAAFGGTGEKTLAEGQLAYLEDSNIVQYYDGSSWATVGPATAGGLVYLTGATFTTVTSVSLPNNTFSATYNNYKIILTLTALTVDSDLSGRMRAGGADDTTGPYQNMFVGIDNNGTASNSTSAGDTKFLLGESDTNCRYTLSADILNPFNSVPTTLHAHYSFLNKAATVSVGRVGTGIVSAATSFDSFSFISSVASSMSGNYKVYGYANS